MKNCFGGFDKFSVALFIIRVPFVNLSQRKFGIGVIIKALLFMVKDSVKRVERDKLDVIGKFFSCKLKKLFKQERGGYNGGPGVKFKTVNLINVRTSSGFIALFKDLNIVSFGG